MCGGNLYRFVSFQSFGYIHFAYLILIVCPSMYIRLVGGCGGQHPLAAVEAMLSVPRAEPGKAEHRALRPGRMPLMKVAPCDRKLSMG